jgi:molecular chaperone DnaK (HSP70)
VLKPTRHKVVVGVDFGTTYSGVAMVWAVSADSRDIEVIAEWPGRMRKNEHLEKVPSKIAYASENEGLEENAWGYEVEPGMLSYSWIKLLLDENANSSEYDSPHLQDKIGNGLMKVPAGKTGEEVAADYLRCLYKHLIARLEKVNGAAIMQETPICFWFTHPATWTDEAIYRTEQAAKAAGFCSRRGDELSLMTEPEAAALAILERDIDKEKGLYKVSFARRWVGWEPL